MVSMLHLFFCGLEGCIELGRLLQPREALAFWVHLQENWIKEERQRRVISLNISYLIVFNCVLEGKTWEPAGLCHSIHASWRWAGHPDPGHPWSLAASCSNACMPSIITEGEVPWCSNVVVRMGTALASSAARQSCSVVSSSCSARHALGVALPVAGSPGRAGIPCGVNFVINSISFCLGQRKA